MLREINDFKKEVSKGIYIDDKGNVYKEIKYSKSNRTYRFEMKGKCIFITKEVKEAFNKISFNQEMISIPNYDFCPEIAPGWWEEFKEKGKYLTPSGYVRLYQEYSNKDLQKTIKGFYV